MKDKMETIRNVYQRYLRGISWEKICAKNILEKMMKKYWIDRNDLEEINKNTEEIEFIIAVPDFELFKQIASNFLNWNDFTSLSIRQDWLKMIISWNLSKVDYIDLKNWFDYYSYLFEEERKKLLQAFVDKFRLYPINIPENQKDKYVNNSWDLSMEKFRQIQSLKEWLWWKQFDRWIKRLESKD